jgi:hypothetical protein
LSWRSPVVGSPARYRTAVFRLSAGRSAFELRERRWCFVADSNRGSPACRAGALAAKLTKQGGARSRTRTWECRCVGPMPWPLGEASSAKARLRQDCAQRELVHPEGLEPPCLAAAASEAAASAVSPRVLAKSWVMVPQRRIERRFPPYPNGALPLDDCGHFRWCWLEDSNLPPLAYEASALPDELSQRCKLTNGPRCRSRCGSDLVGAPGSAPRPNLDVHNVKERGATGAVVTRVRVHGTRTCAHACTPSAHELGLTGLRFALRAICPPALAAEGRPCAGYSGFSLEPCSEACIELEKPQ